MYQLELADQLILHPWQVAELTAWITRSEVTEDRLSQQLKEARSRVSQLQTSNEALKEELLNVPNSNPALLQRETVLQLSLPSAHELQRRADSLGVSELDDILAPRGVKVSVSDSLPVC